MESFDERCARVAAEMAGKRNIVDQHINAFLSPLGMSAPVSGNGGYIQAPAAPAPNGNRSPLQEMNAASRQIESVLERASQKLKLMAQMATTIEEFRACNLAVAAELDALRGLPSNLSAPAVPPSSTPMTTCLGTPEPAPAPAPAAEVKASGKSSTLKYTQSMPPSQEYLNKVIITANGTQAVTASDDKNLYVWELETKTREHTLKGHIKPVMSVIALDEDRIASGSQDCSIKIWSLKDGSCIATMNNAHKHWVTDFTLLPRGRLVSCSKDKTAKIWSEKILVGNNGSGEGCLATLEGEHKRDVHCCAALGPAHVVTGSADKTLKVWKLNGVESDSISAAVVATLEGHANEVKCVVCLDPEGAAAGNFRLASGGKDNSIKIWHGSSEGGAWSCVLTLLGHVSYVQGLAVLGADRLVSASSDRTLVVWKTSTGEDLYKLEGHQETVKAVFVHGEKTIVSCSDDKTVKCWALP